ncbi:MAG: electron transfer flavoprotein subunit beta/FixA family protein [Pseudomonadota bacterium]|nr:electron transfer flavoprotein subunit beta/FixA family protein [Pseudomonadota bacterium]
MKALVTVKSAIDYQVKVSVKSDESGVETDGVQMSMNPFDAIAVEACVQLQSQGIISDSSVITIDTDETMLRQSLAMGIDHAYQVKQSVTEPFTKAQILAQFIQKHPFDLIIMGKLGIDGDHSQIPSLLSGMLNWNCITNASNISVKGKQVLVDKETDDGIATFEMQTPGIISCDLRLNTPSFVALPKLLQAKKQPISLFTPNLDIAKSPHKTLSVKVPPSREGCQPVEDLDTFIQQLIKGGIIE